jgi:hypothetical protein
MQQSLREGRLVLRLIYDPVAAGAPSQYGAAIDRLSDADGATLQEFPKAQPGFAAPGPQLEAAVDAWLALRGNRAQPVVVMVHGYLYDPTSGAAAGLNSPFNFVYGQPPAVDRHQSWLPLVGECDENGQNLAENAVAFAYRSEAAITETARAGWSNGYQYAVFDLSPLAARALAAMLACLGTRQVTARVLAHSLGTRTFSQAVRLLRARMPGNIDRAILLDGAEFCVDAAVNFAGCTFDVINVVNRTDTVLRLGADQMCHPMRPAGTLAACVIGYDGLGNNERWADLQYDNTTLVNWFAAANAPDGVPYRINPVAEEESHPFAGLDHWSCYTNDGNRALVRDLLASDVMTVAQLRAHGAPTGTNSPSFGRFNGVPVTLTPQSMVERQRLIAQASQPAATGVGD